MRVRLLLLITAASSLTVAGFVLWGRGAREIAAPAKPASAAWSAPVPAADDSPWWRGSESNGISRGNPPVQWSLGSSASGTHEENIAWQTPIPGRGHSSPIVWGQQVFLTTSDADAQKVALNSYDRQTGQLRWTCLLQQGDLPRIHVKNSHASSTPACDGRHVYVPVVAEDTLWMIAVTLDGQIAWRTKAGPYRSEEGYAASPAIHESLVIVAADSRGPALDRVTGSAFIAAIDRRSGEIVWRVKRPGLNSYGTPIVGKVAGRNQLLLSAGRYVASYDPLTGAQLWQHEWSIDRTAGTPAFDNERVFVSATIWKNSIVCLRGNGKADPQKSLLEWSVEQGAADVPSPLRLQDRLYILSDTGILSCFNSVDGKLFWKKRFPGPFSASPVGTTERIYLANEQGVTYVVDPATGNKLAENPLLDSIYATPTICGDELLIRTKVALYSLRVPQLTDSTLSQSPSQAPRISSRTTAN